MRTPSLAAASDWIVPDWPAPPNVKALFTTRKGGVSRGPYASFNLGDHVGDSPSAVDENRALLRQLLPGEPIWLTQVHGIDPVNIDDPACMLRGADASFTRQTGSVCAMLAADCLPILFCDRTGTVAGAIHAGWRGLAGGVIEQTLSNVRAERADLMAWLGPAIGPSHFEVGEEVRGAFVQHNPNAAQAFIKHPSQADKWLANLFLLARQRLIEAGIREIHGGGICTFSNPERFFSYRRDGITGRMAALIWIAS